MPITKFVDLDFVLPFDIEAFKSGDPDRIAEAYLELAETLQQLIRDLSGVANEALALTVTNEVYYALPDQNGDFPIGTWRTKQVGNNLEDQVQLSLGTWTTAHIRERPV